MAATTFNGCLRTINSHGYIGNSALHQEFGNGSLRLTSKGFKINLGVLGKDRFLSSKRSSGLIQASSVQKIVSDQILTPLTTKADSPKKSSTVMVPYLE